MLPVLVPVPLPVLVPVAGVPVAPAEPVAAPCVPPLMSLLGGVVLVPVPVPVPVLPDGVDPPLEVPFEPLPDDEPLIPPGVAPDMPVPVWPLGFVDEPLDGGVDEPLDGGVDEPLDGGVDEPLDDPLVPLPLVLPEPDEPLPDEPVPDELLPDMPLPDVLPPDDPLIPLPPLMLPLLPERLERVRRLVRRRVERFFVPVLSCDMLLPAALPAVLPEPVEPVPPVDVCADAASGSTAIVASVAMRFRMGPVLGDWFRNVPRQRTRECGEC